MRAMNPKQTIVVTVLLWPHLGIKCTSGIPPSVVSKKH